MLKKCLLIVLILVAMITIFVMDTVVDSGAYKTIKPHFNGSCKAVEGVIGAEDITIDPSNGLAYLSSHDRRNWLTGGGIYTYQPGSYSTPVLMPHDFEGKLYPHGISLWKNDKGADRLFVINHPLLPQGNEFRTSSEVVVFDVMDSELKWVKTLTTDLPYSLNDVAAINGERFYATIDKGSLTRFDRSVELYGRLARGGIAYGNDQGIVKLVDDLTYPNGIQVSPNGDSVYVSESTGERLVIYQRDPNTDELMQTGEVVIDSGLDNLEWDADGYLWVGAHPQMLEFLKHSRNSQNRSASQVLRIDSNNTRSVEEVYLNKGNDISGASVAAVYKGHLLIGSVFEPFILDCAMSH